MQLDPSAAAAGVRLLALGETTSTNKEALAGAHLRSPLWVTAVSQTRGRGRHGRTWLSPAGNLYASLGLVDPAPVDRAPELAFVSALALRDSVTAEAPALAGKLTFKWPNDLLLADRKCAGILIEGEVRLDHEDHPQGLTVVIGIGVNCVSHPTDFDFIPPGLPEPVSSGDKLTYPATDLRANGAEVTAEQLFTRLSATMCQRIAQWERGNGLPGILSDWRSHASGIGETIAVRDHAGRREKVGRFTGLDESGRLLLELPDGTTEIIAAGDVFLFEARGGRTIPGGSR